MKHCSSSVLETRSLPYTARTTRVAVGPRGAPRARRSPCRDGVHRTRAVPAVTSIEPGPWPSSQLEADIQGWNRKQPDTINHSFHRKRDRRMERLKQGKEHADPAGSAVGDQVKRERLNNMSVCVCLCVCISLRRAAPKPRRSLPACVFRFTETRMMQDLWSQTSPMPC